MKKPEWPLHYIPVYGVLRYVYCIYIFGHYRVSRGWGKWRTINAVEKEETNKSWEIGLIKNAAHIVVW